MGYQFWDGIPRKADDQTRIAAFVAAELAKQDALSELNDVNIPAPNDGDVLTWSPPKWVAAAPNGNGVGDQSWARHFKIGIQFWSPLATTNPGGGWVINANRLYAVAWPPPIQMTFDRIGVWINAGAAGSVRLGIYDDDGTYPGSLILDAGTIDCTAVGLKLISINEQLSAGLFWLAFISDATPNVRQTASFQGVTGRTDTYGWQVMHKVDRAYGALPATFPGGTYNESGRLAAIVLRRSA